MSVVAHAPQVYDDHDVSSHVGGWGYYCHTCNEEHYTAAGGDPEREAEQHIADMAARDGAVRALRDLGAYERADEIASGVVSPRRPAA